MAKVSGNISDYKTFTKRAFSYGNLTCHDNRYLSVFAPHDVSGIINTFGRETFIDRLEKRGYLARLPKSGDKRIANIALTSSGEELLSTIPPLLHEQLSTKLQSLDEPEIRKVENSLETLVRLLDIEQLEASPLITLEVDIENDNALNTSQ